MIWFCTYVQKVRRRHVPAFGEWNYNYSDEPWLPTGAVAAGYSARAAEPEACSEVWFNYSPAPRKPAPKNVRRPGSGGVAPEKPHDGGKRRLQAARKSRASDASGVATTPEKAVRTVRRPVDADLYQVPPPDFVSHRPRPRVRTDRRPKTN